VDKRLLKGIDPLNHYYQRQVEGNTNVIKDAVKAKYVKGVVKKAEKEKRMKSIDDDESWNI
jgi:hypothetical protein